MSPSVNILFSLLNFSPLFKKIIYLFIYLYVWLRWLFVAAQRLSLIAASRGYSLLQCAGF